MDAGCWVLAPPYVRVPLKLQRLASPKRLREGRGGESFSEVWLLDAGCWMLDAGCWMLDAGCWLLVAGCRVLDGCFFYFFTFIFYLVAGCWHLTPFTS
jgi:hypothetical protein